MNYIWFFFHLFHSLKKSYVLNNTKDNNINHNKNLTWDFLFIEFAPEWLLHHTSRPSGTHNGGVYRGVCARPRTALFYTLSLDIPPFFRTYVCQTKEPLKQRDLATFCCYGKSTSRPIFCQPPSFLPFCLLFGFFALSLSFPLILL